MSSAGIILTSYCFISMETFLNTLSVSVVIYIFIISFIYLSSLFRFTFQSTGVLLWACLCVSENWYELLPFEPLYEWVSVASLTNVTPTEHRIIDSWHVKLDSLEWHSITFLIFSVIPKAVWCCFVFDFVDCNSFCSWLVLLDRFRGRSDFLPFINLLHKDSLRIYMFYGNLVALWL